MCIDIMEIWYGIANEQISTIFDNYLPKTPVFSLLDNNLSIFTKLAGYYACSAFIQVKCFVLTLSILQIY